MNKAVAGLPVARVPVAGCHENGMVSKTKIGSVIKGVRITSFVNDWLSGRESKTLLP